MLLESHGAEEVEKMLADSDPQTRRVARRAHLESLGVEVA